MGAASGRGILEHCQDAGPIVQCADPEGAATAAFQRVGQSLSGRTMFVYINIYIYINLSIYLSINLSINLSIYLSIYLNIYVYVCVEHLNRCKTSTC